MLLIVILVVNMQLGTCKTKHTSVDLSRGIRNRSSRRALLEFYLEALPYTIKRSNDRSNVFQHRSYHL